LAFNARGFAYFLVKDYPHAVADLTEAIRLNPLYQNAYQIRALTYRAMGDSKKAKEDEARARAPH
jgi:Tfp pilus assembly protein PilF